MSGKKIIILGPAFPYRGGIASFNERLAEEFHKNGDEVIIYTFTVQYPSFLFPGKTQYSDKPVPNNLNIIRVVNSLNPFNWLKVANSIRKHKPDILLLRFWIPFMAPCLGTIARLVKRKIKIKVLAIIDNIIPHEKRIGDRLLSQYFVNHVDSFIVMSKSVENDLRVFTKTKPIIYNPHPLFDNYGEAISKEKAKQKLELEVSANYLLFFGLIRDYKGLDLLLEAFQRCKNKEKINIIIAGEFYGKEEMYQELIDKLNIRGNIVLKNKFILDEEVVYYFSAVDMVVQPYKTATQSGVTQIAYQFDKPMLVTNVGGLSEIIQHGKVGYVVEPNSDAIASAIDDFYENKREQFFIEGVKSEKNKFSWQKLVENIYNC